MIKNVGSLDRILRILIGIALIAIIFIGPQTLWGLIGIIPLATALISWCPLYTLININTGQNKYSD